MLENSPNPLPSATKKSEPAWLKPVAEYIPLVIFFTSYFAYDRDLKIATIYLMVAATCSIILTLIVGRRIPWMVVATTLIVLATGGLTLYFDDERFIKMKPTVVNIAFAIIMFVGVMLKKPIPKFLLAKAMPLTDRGWHLLSIRFGLFFLFLAGVNEYIWRYYSTDFWISFKLFGSITITFIFLASQVPFFKKHMIDPPPQD